MDKNELLKLIENSDIFDERVYKQTLDTIKHNICQNLRIARKLSKMDINIASQLLQLEPQSLRRIEAENDRDEFSSKVLIMAIMIYKPDANFYFSDWKKNELLLKE